MSDQASELRKLVMRATRERAASVLPPPKVIALIGGKRSVGTTTLAVRLAIELARQGLRTVLIDANLSQSDVSNVCGIRETVGIEDVLAARHDIHEVLVRGPSGLQIIPGVPVAGGSRASNPRAEQRLFQQIHTLGPHTDAVIVDCGDVSNSLVPRFWATATDVVLVTTADADAVMNSYAAIKVLYAGSKRKVVRLLVNRVGDEATARDAAERIERSCQRFLGIGTHWLGHVPEDIPTAVLDSRASTLIVDSPDSAVARAIYAIAIMLMTPVDGGDSRENASVA